MNNMDWTFSLSTPAKVSRKNPLRWRKESLFVGAKPVLANGQVREITDEDLDIMLAAGKERMEMGIKHPLVFGGDHGETRPEFTRGLIDEFKEGVNEDGNRALFLGGTVSTEEDRDTLISNDISILAPAEDRVAGKVWKRAIKNALVTSYPRVKGLAKFELALSENTVEVPVNEFEDEEGEKSVADALRKLRRNGMTSREILKSLERLNSTELYDALMAIEVPVNRFRGDDYEAIDNAAFQFAEKHGTAYLTRDGDSVLILSEKTDEAFRVIHG